MTLLADEARALRETFEVFEEGLCLVGADGELEVANATVTRLYGTALREDLIAATRPAEIRQTTWRAYSSSMIPRAPRWPRPRRWGSGAASTR